MRRGIGFALAAMLLAAPPASPSERAQQRLVERHAESVVFPALVERCRALPAFRRAPWAAELSQWRQRRAQVHGEARALVKALAEANGQTLAALDARIAAQTGARDAAADADTLGFTCERLRFTLRGEPYVPMTGAADLDEDTLRSVLDQLLPVAQKLIPCDEIERIEVRPAPPPVLRVDASSAAALADRVQMWNAVGCGKAMDVEVSLRFPQAEPPTFALGFPRSAAAVR